MGPPAASPYSVGVSGPMENHRNGIVEKSVFLTHIPNLRYQRRRESPGPALPGLRISYVFRNPPGGFPP